MDAPGPWRWKVATPEHNEQLDLLYEPGNWGDILKGTWALAVTRALVAAADAAAVADDRAPRADHARRSAPHPNDAAVRDRAAPLDARPLAVLDPWAGAPTWPLVADAAARMSSLGASAYVAAQDVFLRDGRLASTGRLVRAAALAAGRSVHARVFDLSPARRAAWSREPGVDVLALDDGAVALAAESSSADLLLVDPYDLFESADVIVPRLAARRDRATLLYLFNKAPRGAAAFRTYGHLREALQRCAAATARAVLVGRIPSDARLPRAYHEVLLLADASLVDAVRDELRAATHELALPLATQGSFEEGAHRDHGARGL